MDVDIHNPKLPREVIVPKSSEESPHDKAFEEEKGRQDETTTRYINFQNDPSQKSTNKNGPKVRFLFLRNGLNVPSKKSKRNGSKVRCKFKSNGLNDMTEKSI